MPATVPAQEPLLSAHSTATALVCREGPKGALSLPGEQKVLSAAQLALTGTWSKAIAANAEHSGQGLWV